MWLFVLFLILQAILRFPEYFRSEADFHEDFVRYSFPLIDYNQTELCMTERVIVCNGLSKSNSLCCETTRRLQLLERKISTNALK